MKKRNIGICIITTTLLMGGPAKATELILAKDHTNVVNQTLTSSSVPAASSVSATT